MHVDLITTTKGSPKVVHATDNSKKTACGINLTKPENIGQFASAGELSDVIQITCEKCKTIIAKKLIKESNREMAAQLKEEQRRLKRERAAAKHQHGGAVEVPPVPQVSSKPASGGYIPPSMRKTMQEQQHQAPIETPTPAPAPAPMPRTSPAAAAHNDALSQFAIPTVPTSVPGAIPLTPPPAPAPAPSPAPAEVDDVLAQFAIPTVPTSVPGAIPITPPSAPAPAPAPSPAPAEVDDVLAQFAIPTVPTSVPGAIPIAPPPAPAPAPAPSPAPAKVDDVLAQFAIPTVPTSVPGVTPIAPPPAPAPAPAPSPAPAEVDDVLAQFAIPTVPTSVPHSAPQFNTPTVPVTLPPASAQNEDVLSQFAIPTVPTELPSTAPKRAPSADPDDLLAKFSAPADIPSIDTPPAIGNAAVTDDILAQFSVNPPTAAPQLSPMEALGIDAQPIEAEIDETLSAIDNKVSEDDILDITPIPAPEPVGLDSLDDLLLMPGKGQAKPAAPVMPEPLPDIATVPTSAPAAQYPGISPMAMPQQSVPTLNVPPVPQMTVPQQPVPTLNVPPVPQMTVPQQPVPQIPVPTVPTINVPQQPSYQPQHNSLYSVPSAPQPQDTAPTPLFVGYSADGRQLFQKYDALGNPIPINEPVYSAPPEQPSHQVRAQVQTLGAGAAAPVMDMDELMASMGIEDPSKRKKDEGKAINFTEYKIPPKKAKKSAPKKAAEPKPAETGPISAAEAKRRKKVDKINKEFEKQLRSRGIDPKTGGLILDPKK